ncbi:MAG TPA: hypothetical protein VNO21_07300, partial [Polyangiaceae bacterium]|nr:hypothetical protein [Polyangiaceae bacterium]
MSASILSKWASGSLFSVLVLSAAAARAQDQTPPATAGGTSAQSSASSGSTSVVNGNFAGSAQKDEKEGTAVQIQAGGLFAAGNSRSIAMTASANVRHRS